MSMLHAFLGSLLRWPDGVVVKVGNELQTGGAGAGGTFTFDDTPPASPNAGDRWVDSDTGVLFVYVDDGTSSQWVEF
jgi:hypothetical protein